MSEQIIDLPATVPRLPVQCASQAPDSMLALVERAARDPNIDVGKMERLLELAEKVQARKAEAEYDAAMNSAQSEMRPVVQDSDNPQTRSRYASYTAMDGALRPIYTHYGFSLSFGTKSPAPDRVTITCRVSHRAGHTEKVEIDMPCDGKGAKGNDVMTKTHATGSAVSYGMRYLLKMIFNVAIGEYDDDGNAASPPRPVERPAPATPYRPPPTALAAPAPQGATATPAKATTEKEWGSFLASCKAKFLSQLVPCDEWAWWKHATDKSWILPNESLADADPAKMFAGFDRASFKESIKAVADAHRAAVNAMLANCPPEFEEEIKRGFVPMPKTVVQQAPPPASPKANGCFSCNSTATTKHDDLIGVIWCKACGVQWKDGSTVPYEEHQWMFARLPFAPKAADKKSYKGMTLGQLARIDSKYWFGIVMNFKAEPYNGRPPSAESVKFGEACEEARKHLDGASDKREEGLSALESTGQDDIPF